VTYAPLAESVIADLVGGTYAFIDAGCAAGRSIEHCQRRFERGRGLGLDWYGPDLDIARNSGLAVAQCNLATLELPRACVSFVSMVDFVEHLPDVAATRRLLETCGAAARDFLFIRHPSFDEMEYLHGLGVKMTWTDWPCHTNMMRMVDFERLFAEMGWTDYTIRPHLPLLDSMHPAMVPLCAPPDTQAYDAAAHGPKQAIAFERPIYGKFDLFVRLNRELDDATWANITSMDGWRAIWESCGSNESTDEPQRMANPIVVDLPISADLQLPPPGFAGASKDLARVFDPWLARCGRPLPEVQAYIDEYLHNHLVQCLKWKDFFFLRLAHLMDAVGRIPEPIVDVLSFGAGMGYQDAFLAGRCSWLQVKATDWKLRNAEFPMPNLRFETLDLLDPPPEDEQYDFVFSIECLEHIADYHRAFRHHAARVKMGKYLYVSVPYASRDQQQDPELCRAAWELAEHVVPGFAFEDLQAMFETNGFEVLHASNMFHLDVVLPVRHILDAASPADIEASADALAHLLLLDLQDRRVSTSTESEGIRFLGRRVR